MKNFNRNFHPNLMKNCRPRQSGFTLIELLISTTISLGVMAAALALFAGSQHSYRTQSLNRQIQENARFALQIISEDLRMARYFGVNISPSVIDLTEPSGMTFGCGAAGWASDFTQPVFAQNNANPYSANCIDDANHEDNTDVLVIRHVDSEPVATSNIKQSHLYLYTSLTEGFVFRADADSAIDAAAIAAVTETPRYTFKLSTSAYYIRPCSNPADAGNTTICDAGDDTIPTLVRETLTANDTLTQPLVEDIENMQVTFGIDDDGDFTVDRYVGANNIGATEWDQVYSARVFVLARSPSSVTGYTNNNTYIFGDVSVNPGDHLYRKLFSETLYLRNPAMDVAI